MLSGEIKDHVVSIVGEHSSDAMETVTQAKRGILLSINHGWKVVDRWHESHAQLERGKLQRELTQETRRVLRKMGRK